MENVNFFLLLIVPLLCDLKMAPLNILTVSLISVHYYLFHDSGPYQRETSSLTCTANQQTGFYVIGASVMKELHCNQFYCGFNFTQHKTRRQQKTARVEHDTTQHNRGATQENMSTTRHNTRQHECNTRQYEYNTRQHEYNTSAKQPKSYFGLFISWLHTRSLVQQALKLCLCYKTQKTENRFFL